MSAVVRVMAVGAGSICSAFVYVKMLFYRKLIRKNLVDRLRAAGM
jgi:hypothetical protein